MFLIHLINDRRSTPQRLVAKKNRLQRLQCTDAVVVNDFQYMCKFDAIHGLRNFVMIDQNQLFFAKIQQISAGDHTHVTVIFIQNRKIAVAFFTHDAFDIFRLIRKMECRQIISLHEIFNRHTLIDHTRRRKGIIWSYNNIAVVLLCHFLNCPRYFRIHTHNNTVCSHLNRT